MTLHGCAGLGPNDVLDRRESRKVRHDFVVAGRQPAKHERAAAISQGVLRAAVTHLYDSDGYAWQQAAVLVVEHAFDRPSGGLGLSRALPPCGRFNESSFRVWRQTGSTGRDE